MAGLSGATTGAGGGFTLAVPAGAVTVSVRTVAIEITTAANLDSDTQRNITLPRPTRSPFTPPTTWRTAHRREGVHRRRLRQHRQWPAVLEACAPATG